MTTFLGARADASVRSHLAAGAAAVLLLFVGLGAAASVARIAGAVIAPGTLVVVTHVKKVQHPTGGIVGELRVREGDTVEKGAVLLRLDDTLTRANLEIVRKKFAELTARKARLEAERDGRAEIDFPQTLAQSSTHEEVGRLLDGERRLFQLRRTATAGRKEQLREQIKQLTEAIAGLKVRGTAKADEIGLIARELKGARELWAKGLYQITKLTALEREATRLQGERGQLLNLIAETKGKTSETELAILQIDHDLSSEVGKDLRDIEAQLGELAERKIAAEDQLRRIDIRAPHTGAVQQLAVHTVGGVIAPGDTIMLIVPQGEELHVETRVAPQDVDQLQVGQNAILRFSAFNQGATPEIGGKVRRISADVQTDPLTGAPYYLASIAISSEARQRLGELKLVPGMPVEAFLATSERTLLSYLLKPLTDQTQRAFRDD